MIKKPNILLLIILKNHNNGINKEKLDLQLPILKDIFMLDNKLDLKCLIKYYILKNNFLHLRQYNMETKIRLKLENSIKKYIQILLLNKLLLRFQQHNLGLVALLTD
jgi:hypothetical protein